MIEIGVPLNQINSNLYIGGSKSISNRLLILDFILDLNLHLSNISNSEDTQVLIEGLKRIKNTSSATIDIKHAGTDMRFLTALLSITEGKWILSGSDRMKERPIGELVKALKLLGADISYREKENYPPLLINGKKLSGGKISIDAGISSQFISALLLIAPRFEKGLELHLKGNVVSRPYINMSLALLKAFDIQIQQSSDIISVSTLQSKSTQKSFSIESDWSSASYYYSICALSKNAQIELKHFDQKSLQADSVLPELYKELGVQTEFKQGVLILRSIPITSKEFIYDFTNCPDIAQTIAITCVGLGISCTLSGLSTLKIKESDRIIALKTELEKFGAIVDVGMDFIRVIPESRDKNQDTRNKKQETRNLELPTIDTYNDHRMAMSFAPLALKFGNLQIKDPSVVNKSYPGFWEDLKSLGFNVNLSP